MKNEFLEYFHFRVKKEMEKKMPKKVEIVKKVEPVRQQNNFHKPAKRLKLVDYDDPVSFSIKPIQNKQPKSLQKPAVLKTVTPNPENLQRPAVVEQKPELTIQEQRRAK